MAPSAPLSSSAAAQQDATDARINQTVFAFAFAAAGLILLGAVAYICFWIIGRWTKSSVEGEDNAPPRPLILPVKLEEAGKAPKRMILSPLYTLPLQELEDQELEDPDKDHWTTDGGCSWRASLHAMGMRSTLVRYNVPPAIIWKNAHRDVGFKPFQA